MEGIKNKFEIGDIVTIRKDLEKTSKLPTVVTEMLYYAGNTATIMGIIHDTEYNLDIDDMEWTWADWMFESKKKTWKQILETQ